MDYSKKTRDELVTICKELNIKGISKINKLKLIDLIKEKKGENIEVANIEEPIKLEHNNEVLEHCKIPDSINIEEIKSNISKYMASRAEYYRKKNRAPFIEDEFSEYYVAGASKGIEIGGGNCSMDVITQNNEGIDVMCVIMNKYSSNEKSLIQNFSFSGTDLDTLFREKKDVEALNLYINQYSKKLYNIKFEENLSDLYILSFISTHKDVYLTCFKINLDNIKNISTGGFVNNQKDLCTNIMVNNFINPLYGNVRLYKSKKRMELRLLPDILKSEHTIKIYSIN